ncbi:MAG: A/G-specific adenine glycosylase [Bacillota bacterium]
MSKYILGDWKNFDQKRIENIQNNLIHWYKKNHRKLPWRETRDPYYIWISEVMLQQTRVETVIPYYENFIRKFPTIHALADAKEEEVLKAWEGLGYYKRARNLAVGARYIVTNFNGKMPAGLQEILKIPGIGAYTAGAVLSIAFSKVVPAVDGNVMRVFSRLFYVTGDIMEGKTRKEMEKIGYALVPSSHPSFFNQSLMELGALICTPTAPKCTACPVFDDCEARKEAIQDTLPIRKKKEKIPEIEMELAFVRIREKFLITKRPSEGLLAELWTLPSVERDKHRGEGKSIHALLEDLYGLCTDVGNPVAENHHIFTHMKWKMKTYGFLAKKEVQIDYPEIRWITWDELSDYAVPTAFMKVFKKIRGA